MHEIKGISLNEYNNAIAKRNIIHKNTGSNDIHRKTCMEYTPRINRGFSQQGAILRC